LNRSAETKRGCHPADFPKGLSNISIAGILRPEPFVPRPKATHLPPLLGRECLAIAILFSPDLRTKPVIVQEICNGSSNVPAIVVFAGE
jgi:hypothetical protein